MDFNEEIDEELDTQTLTPIVGKEGIVFLVDATEPMFDGLQFSLAIQCVENLMKNSAICRPTDETALILFGTTKTSNEESYQYISIVHKLQKPSAELILNLKQLNQQNFSSNYGHNSEYSLAEVFSLAIEEFTQSNTRFQSKRVILFTNVCNPYSTDSDDHKLLRQTAVIRAKTFDNYNIDCDLIPLTPKDNQVFDIDMFYAEVFPQLKEEKCDTLVKLEPLLRRVHTKSSKHRVLASIPFYLRRPVKSRDDLPEVKISIKVYNLYSVAKKPAMVTLNRNVVKRIGSQNMITVEESSQQEMSTQQQSESSPKEVEHMLKEKVKQNFEDPGLTLLGFKPRSALMAHIHVKPGHFIVPDENKINGSTTLFSALLKRCVERDKLVICRLTIRNSQPPHLVALYPQIESKPLERSGGFHVVYLPFKEDMRDPNVSGAQQMPIRVEALSLTKRIVEKLTFDYNPKDFPNPVLQTHYRVIECLALNEPIERFDDSQTQPNYEDIESKAGYDMYSLNQLLGGYAVQFVKPAEKPVKVFDDLSLATKQNKLGVFTVAELREFCRLKRIDCGYKKAELIEAIRQFYETHKSYE